MTGEPEIDRSPIRPLLGHPWRTSPETLSATLLILGHFFVFLLSMAHDEIVLEMVEKGWVVPGSAERAEILMGFVLFLAWGFLTVRLVDLMRRPGGSGTMNGTGR